MRIDDRSDYIGRFGICHLVVENLDIVDDDISCDVRSPFLRRSDNSVARTLRCGKEQNISVEYVGHELGHDSCRVLESSTLR